MSQKRNRSVNWDREEKQLLLTVLQEYTKIIENKSIDSNSNKMRNNAWEQVHKKFNSLNNRPRELNQLKIQWKVMKRNVRNKHRNYKKEDNKTGGRASEVKDPIELLRDHNIYDSDGIMTGELATCPIKIQASKLTRFNDNIVIIENEIETNEDVDAQVGVEELTPLVTFSEEETTVRTPMSQNKDTKSVKKDHEDCVNSMISHSKMLKNEEHMSRMEMIKEEHKIKMEILRENLKSAILEREILELKKAREAL